MITRAKKRARCPCLLQRIASSKVVTQKNIAIKEFKESWAVGVVKFFKVPFIKCFSTGFGPIVTDLPSIFCLIQIWSCTVASKLGGLKSTLLNKSCSNQKILEFLFLKLLKLYLQSGIYFLI